MGSVKRILLRVRAAHYGDVTNQMAEAFGVFRGTAGKWFHPKKPTIPEPTTCRAIEAKHPIEAEGLFAAWEAETKQNQRSTRRTSPTAPALPSGPFHDLDPAALAQLPPADAAAEIERWRAAIRTDAAERAVAVAKEIGVPIRGLLESVSDDQIVRTLGVKPESSEAVRSVIEAIRAYPDIGPTVVILCAGLAAAEAEKLRQRLAIQGRPEGQVDGRRAR